MLWPTLKQQYEINPFENFNRLHNQLNRLFNDGHGAYPAMNVYTNEENVILTAELPGYEKDEIKITTLNNVITLEGNLKQEEDDGGKTYYREERRRAAFKRAFKLPFEAEAENVNAAYKNGVLTVTVPKAEVAKPKKIEITG